MASSFPSVLYLFGPPRQKSYRLAIADVLRRVKRENNLTLVELGERLGCSDQTIRNAMDEDGTDCLGPVTMLRIGFEFGEEVLEPVFGLARRETAAPLTAQDRIDEIERHLQAIRKELSA